ncbi:MAG: serine protease [Actinomycetota bacterium]
MLTLTLTACGDDGRDATATHRLIIEPCSGRVDQRATGAAIGPELVATVAHSLDGVRHIEMRGPDGRSQSAEVVYLDPAKDIALLRPDRPLSEYLTMIEPEGPGPVGVIRYDDTEQRPRIDQGDILELVSVTLDGEGRRDAARLAATIEPGDSGAAVIDDDGAMVAMVFATARSGDVGWAVSAVEVQAAVDALARRGPASPPAC